MTSLEKLVALFLKQGIVATVDDYECVIITNGPIRIWIKARPWYCDRGRWQLNAESDDYRLCIDGADGFPRYYFDPECMVKEAAAWMDVRIANFQTLTDKSYENLKDKL